MELKQTNKVLFADMRMRPLNIADQASKSGSVQVSMRDGEDSRSVQKSQRSVENGDVEEAFEFLGDGEAKKEERRDNPVVGGNVVDDDEKQPIPEGKVSQLRLILREFNVNRK